MSDELPEAPDQAIRLWLAAIGFTIVLIGGEMMAEKDGARFGLGLALILISLPVHLGWAFWRAAKARLARGVVLEMGAIATSPRWWFALLSVLLLAMIFTPVVQVPRWPTFPFSRVSLTTLSTSIRLQINAESDQPVELDKHNIELAYLKYKETIQNGEHSRRTCIENTRPQPNFSGLTTSLTLPSYSCENEAVPEYESHRYVLFIFTFPVKIQPKEITLDAHGARLPKWQTVSLKGNSAIVRFDGELSRMVLDILVQN